MSSVIIRQVALRYRNLCKSAMIRKTTTAGSIAVPAVSSACSHASLFSLLSDGRCGSMAVECLGAFVRVVASVASQARRDHES